MKLTFICKVISTSDDDMSFQVDNRNQMEEGSSGVGNLGNHDLAPTLVTQTMTIWKETRDES